MKLRSLFIFLVCVMISAVVTACNESHEHKFESYSLITNPTMDTVGSATATCSCNESTTIEVPALSDTSVWTVKSSTDSTCTEAGSKVFESIYGEVTVDLELLDHEYTTYTIVTEPTMDAVGSATVTCSCTANKTVEVPALSDTSVWTVKSTTNSTCSVAGNKVFESIYGEVTVALELLDHEYTTYTLVTNPTMDAVGSATAACACSATTTVEVPALSDSSVWTVKSTTNSTCSVAGNKVFESVYGKVTVALELLDHEYTTYTLVTNPTMDAKGSATATCACTASKTVEVPALSDASVWTVKSTTNSTCTEAGNKVYESIYGEVTVTLPLAKHEYVSFELVADPTVEAAGSAIGTCSCGATETVEVPALNDKNVWTVAVIPADYNKGETRTYTSVYGEVVVVLDNKLVAPYDGKSYVSLRVDGADEGVYKNGVITALDNWNDKILNISANGTGYGSGYPFRAFFEFVMIDPATGRISVTKHDAKSDGKDENGNDILVKDPEAIDKIYTGYVDFETGIIILDGDNEGIHFVMVPYETIDRNDLSVSVWNEAIAMTYTDPNGNVQNIFIDNGVSNFYVSFTDIEGNAVEGKDCYNSSVLYVKDRNNENIKVFAFDGEKLVVADGLQGTYTTDNNTIIVTGAGFATFNGEEATYVIINDSTIGVYTVDSYYEVTLDIVNKTFTSTKPMVEITFEANGKAEIENVSANKNVLYVLPTLSCETHTFKGWFYDAACTSPVEADFKPTVDVTLYALWKEKVVINLVGVLEGDSAVIYLGEGDVIGDYLPKYSTDAASGRKFAGWYIDENFEMSLPEEYEVGADDTGVVIYAKWEELPPYIGTYKGSEIWNASYGNSGGKNLTIDENGNISGLKTGVIISYNPETQIVEWKQNSNSAIYKFYFNATLGVIAGMYDNNNIGNDYYILSKSDADGKANAHYGIKVAKSPTDSTRGWYAQFVNITTDLGDVEIFLYNNHIYDTFTATNAFGDPLTAATVKDSKTLIVKDSNGNIIVSVASMGPSFESENDTIDLDQYFGTYTNGDEEVVLDGVGNIKYGELTGTYAVASEGASYGFDVYFNNNTEYYELSLNGSSFTLNKVMVTITYEEGEYVTIADEDVNKNISFELPVLTHETNVFNGWFFDADYIQPVGTKFVPTADVTLYALWKVKVTLTINSNNGTEAETVIYSEGDTVLIDTPVLKGQAFAGWYTTEGFVEGTEWTNGSVINENTVIYAKWEAAPAYYNNYTATRLEFASSSKTTGTTYSYCYKNLSTGPYMFEIDANGTGTNTNAPLNGSYSVENYNEETGYLELVLVDSYNNSNVYRGYLDKETGIIITTYLSGMDRKFDKVLFFNPFTEEVSTSTNLSSSYWAFGGFRAIEYTYDETTYGMFVMGDQVYFGVTFEDGEGNTVTGVEAYTQSILLVKDRDGEVIAKFAMGDAELELMDGNEGTYINGADTLVIDGVKTATLNGVAGTYTASEEGSTYGFDVYVGGSYYEVSLNKEEGTYTINKPMVTITFDSGEQAIVEAVNTNKNIEITLPTLTNDMYVFRGWFADAELNQPLNSTYLPTESTTIYAKWDTKVTLTVVYGNGLENTVLEYGAGDITAPVEPVFTAGKVFAGWYLDAEFTTPYEIGTIAENTTIYCNWMDSVAMYGSFTGFNLFGAGNKNSLYFNASLEVSADGQVTGKKTGSVSDYNPETGTFMIGGNYAVYDELGGAIAVAFGSNATGIGNDLYLMFKKTAKSGEQSGNLNGSFIKLVTINFADGTSENYLVMNDRIYSGVTWTADGDYTAYTAGNASSLTIYARDGQTVLFSY